MFISIEHPEHMYYHVYDILSQSEIIGCVWADDKLDKYCRYKRNKRNGEELLIRGDEVATEIRRGKIKIMYFVAITKETYDKRLEEKRLSEEKLNG